MKTENRSIRCVIVEDDEVIHLAIKDMIDASTDIECVGVFASEEEAVSGIFLIQPDIVLMDIKLNPGNGIDCIQRVKHAHPETQCIVITIFEEEEKVFDSLKAGATGYIVKSSSTEDYLSAIRTVAAGGSPLSPVIAKKVVSYFSMPHNAVSHSYVLTEREKAVVELLSEGYPYKQVADKLFISMDTVRTHIRNIYEKLQVHSRTEALNKLYRRQ